MQPPSPGNSRLPGIPSLASFRSWTGWEHGSRAGTGGGTGVRRTETFEERPVGPMALFASDSRKHLSAAPLPRLSPIRRGEEQRALHRRPRPRPDARPAADKPLRGVVRVDDLSESPASTSGLRRDATPCFQADPRTRACAESARHAEVQGRLTDLPAWRRLIFQRLDPSRVALGVALGDETHGGPVEVKVRARSGAADAHALTSRRGADPGAAAGFGRRARPGDPRES